MAAHKNPSYPVAFMVTCVVDIKHFQIKFVSNINMHVLHTVNNKASFLYINARCLIFQYIF